MGTSAMIALLPVTTDWAKVELPHMTLVYAGEIDNLSKTAFNDMAKDASMLASISRPLMLEAMGKEVFGGDGEEKVDVLRFRPTLPLMAMRRAVEKWNASQHDFKPHVTIGPQGTFLDFPPRYVSFDRIIVGWGDEYLNFSLVN